MTYVPISVEHDSLSNALTEAYSLSGALVNCRPVQSPDLPNFGERIIHEDDKRTCCSEPRDHVLCCMSGINAAGSPIRNDG